MSSSSSLAMLRCVIALANFLIIAHGGRAQISTLAVGALEGRVSNPSNDQFVGNARLTIEGTALETFSDADGHYRFASIPAGTARVTAFYTGLQPQIETVSVATGQVVQLDFHLFPSTRVQPDRGSEPIALPRFAVTASREIEGTALAIHEQRFAPNIKHVVSADEFGFVAESNVAEFLKFLPGVTVDFQAGNARYISVNGAGPANIPVTIEGFGLASAEPGGMSRTVQVDMVSLNNLSRVEVDFAPTPETPGSALVGAINLVPRSSFERSRRIINGSFGLGMPQNARAFHRVPGARRQLTRNVQPTMNFSAIVPLTRRLGFTLSGSHSTAYSALESTNPVWHGAALPTNGTTFPHTTPDRPYLTSYLIGDNPREQTRRSLGGTLDFKPTLHDRVSIGFQFSSFDAWYMGSALDFNIFRVLPGEFSTTSTRSSRGQANLVLMHTERSRHNRTYMPTLTWRHDGPVWRLGAGAGFSQASDHDRDIQNGSFQTVTALRQNVSIAFEDIGYLRPGRITVTDAFTLAPVDPYSLSSYAVNSAGGSPGGTDRIERSAFASVRRDFFTRVPFTLKAGLDVRQSLADVHGTFTSFGFQGQDGRFSVTPTSDESALPFLDPRQSQRSLPYGFPRIDAVSNHKLWEFFRANPNQFVTIPNNTYRSEVGTSKHAEEVISAAYLRGDVALFARRLKLVGGLRAEQSNVQAEGPLTDLTRNYQRDARGQILRNPNGSPLLIVPASNALGVSQLTYLIRGTRVKRESLDLFPSINASYHLRENWIARAAYYQAIGRPNFNQYAGGLTLPTDPDSVNSRILVNNAALKPWTARSVVVKVEYYFADVGQFSVGAFRRDFTNSTGGSAFVATPEFLALYGLDEATYGRTIVSTQVNVAGSVRMTGVDFSYKQALTFLPPWARGLQVFANGSAQRATGANRGSFAGSNYVPRSGSGGISLTRERYNFRVNGNYRSQQRRGAVAAGPSIAAGTYSWVPSVTSVDVSGEFSLNRKCAVFAHLRNLTNEVPETFEIAGPSTPPHARLSARFAIGALWSFGIKGSF